MTLTDLLNQSVTIETFNSMDKYGDCSYNVGVAYAARVERRIKIVRTLQGKEAVSTARVFLDGSLVLDKYGRDRITLPDSTQPPILAISDGVGYDGTPAYVEVST